MEHQELDVVESLLSTFSLEELDLNTPNSEGLLPLDIAIMTNNVPMAKLLLRAGAKESPHCEYTRTAIKRMQHEPHFMNHKPYIYRCLPHAIHYNKAVVAYCFNQTAATAM